MPGRGPRVYASLLFTLCLLAASCSPRSTASPSVPADAALYLYRPDPPALVQFSESLEQIGELPFSFPPSCGLVNVFPPPTGTHLAIELSCPNGPAVLLLDVQTGAVTQPYTDVDSHFLAWMPDGRGVYMRIDSLGSSQIVRAAVDGKNTFVPITAFTYDLAPSLQENEFTFTFSRGLGQGSEIWLAKRDGRTVQLLYADALNYLSFARYSPNGGHIAFVKIPDTQIPFTVGGLWLIPSAPVGAGVDPPARKLADADAGHGYAANWSPDGKWIAFVVRANPQDEAADRSAEALISNIHIVHVETGNIQPVTSYVDGRVETPHWSPDGNMLAFTRVLNGRMQVLIADMLTGEIRPLETEPACCPAWMRK